MSQMLFVSLFSSENTHIDIEKRLRPVDQHQASAVFAVLEVVFSASKIISKGLRYVAIFCHVRKKDVPKLIDALEDLKKSMMICGYPKYEEDISDFMEQLESKKGAIAGHENDTDQQAKQEQPA